MDNECKAHWEQIVKIHFATKRIILRSEEFEAFQHQTYIQPIREERDAFEHICRGMSRHLGLSEEPSEPDYLATSFDAARKHTIRAFFDAADWYGCDLREAIRERLSIYGSECIRAALPDYYPKMRSRIDEIIDRTAVISLFLGYMMGH